MSDFVDLFAHYARHGAFPTESRVGIIFEGGALRGVVSAGYAKALSSLAKSNSYTSLYGSSSGALNSIYFLSDQMNDALSIYAENATDKRCTNILRFPNVLNVDWLVDTWMFDKKKFDIMKIIGSKTNTYISLTRLSDGAASYFNGATSSEHTLNQAMKATSYAPLLSNGYQEIGGVRYGDGAIGDAIPYHRAIADGCTHVICLLTRPHGYQKNRDHLSNKLFYRLRLAHHSKEYRKAFIDSDKHYNDLLDYLHNGSIYPVPTMVICPSSASEIPGNIETRAEVISEKGDTSYRNVLSQLKVLFPTASP